MRDVQIIVWHIVDLAKCAIHYKEYLADRTRITRAVFLGDVLSGLLSATSVAYGT